MTLWFKMMTQEQSVTPFYSFFKTGLLTLTLTINAFFNTGCDSGSSGSSSTTAKGSAEAQIEGDVSDIHGPLNLGKLEVKDKNDRVVTTYHLDGQSNHYAIKVPQGTTYPILLMVTPPPGPIAQVVRAVVTSPLADHMDITDITSLVVDAAFALGGLTEENIAKASGGAIGLRQRQGVSAGSGGGGAGAGQSAGGVGHGGHGGHGGHDMSGGSQNPGATPPP